MHIFLPNTHTRRNTCTSRGTWGQNKGLRVLTQILNAQLLDLPGLPILIFLLLPFFPVFAFYPLPPLFSPSLYFQPRLTISLLNSLYLCLPLSLFHNSLSHYNSLYSINSLSPYFIIRSHHLLLFINHPIYVSLSRCQHVTLSVYAQSACLCLPSFSAAVSSAACSCAVCSNLWFSQENKLTVV